MRGRTEQELIAEAVAGDRDALTTLLAKHGPRVRRHVRAGIAARWRGALEIDDILQVTYLEAFLRIDRFRDRGGNAFAGWLSRIAENNLQDAIRGLERGKRLPPEKRITPPDLAESSFALLNTLGMTSETPSRRAAAGEVERTVLRAIDGLPEDYARVLRLYDLQCRSATEVAEEMNRSEGAVYMLRSRALDRLRESLGRESRYFSDA